jgi:RecA-family ATPase
VALHRRNGTKKCPVELLYHGASVLATDTNLRELRDIESLLKHANTVHKHDDWHAILTAVARELPEQSQEPSTFVVKSLDAYTIERKEYLWYPVLPKGEPCSIEGDPGSGKSAVLIKLLSHLTSGTRFPTLFADHIEQDFAPRTVVLFSSEDDPNSTIKLRVMLNGGDPARVKRVEGKQTASTAEVAPAALTDLAALDGLLTTYAPALIAFDPLQSFFGDVDMNKATETRPVLDAVRHLCKAHGCTPLYIRHNGKAQRSKAIHASLGSIDITAHMRSVLALYKDPDDPTRRILAQAKTNGRLAPSMQLRLVGATADVVLNTGLETVEDVRVDWDGKSDITAEDLNARETVHGNDTQEAQSALDQAREFLRDFLREGPERVEDVFAAAKHAGIKRRTLDRAKDKEGVKARRVPCDDVPNKKWPWEWAYPTAQRSAT